MIIIETENTDNNVGYTIEDINLGDFKIYKTTYSKKIHSEFANFSGDKSKIHTDIHKPTYSTLTNLFGG